MHADRTNRVMLTVFGLLLLLAGVAGLVASVGGFGTAFSHRVLFDNRVSRFIGDQGAWLWPVAAIVAALLALLVLRWLIALLFSTDRAGDLRVAGDIKAGRSTLRPGALSDAVSTEIQSYRGVDSVKARVLGDGVQPELVVRVTAGDARDLAGLRHRIETDALAHARQAMDAPDLRIQLDLDARGQQASATKLR